MIWIALGKWSSAGGSWFIRERIYLRGRWTPFVRVRQRYSWAVALAWVLPREVVHQCAIRLIAHATQGQYSDTVVPEIAAMEALRRWE